MAKEKFEFEFVNPQREVDALNERLRSEEEGLYAQMLSVSSAKAADPLSNKDEEKARQESIREMERSIESRKKTILALRKQRDGIEISDDNEG